MTQQSSPVGRWREFTSVASCDAPLNATTVGPRRADSRRVRAGGVPLVENSTHPATGIAVTATRCALFTRPALEAAIAEHPSIAFLLARRLASRVRLLVHRLDDRSAQTVDARLAAYLLARPALRDGATISLGMTQQALAEELGTVREVVGRRLRSFCRRQLLEPRDGGRYAIIDRAALESLATGG